MTRFTADALSAPHTQREIDMISNTPAPTPSPAVSAVDGALDACDVGRMIYVLTHTGELSMPYRCRIADALDALRAQQAPAGVQDHAEMFDRAGWFWRTMDPDDCADSPQEAIHRSMVGLFCVCEIASSFTGPTRFGFNAPVLDQESDDEEFLHFATMDEAIEAARVRAALIGGEA